MSGRNALQDLIRRGRRRQVRNLLVYESSFAAVLALGGAILLLLVGTQILNWYWLVLLFVVSLSVGAWRARGKVLTSYQVAQSIDHKLDLHDALSTAYFFDQHTENHHSPAEFVDSQRNMAEEMMELTLEAAVRTLFGTTLPGEAQQVGHAVSFLMRYSLRRARAPFRIPAGWPTPKNRRATKEFGFLDSLVYRIIAERKAQGNGHRHGDLLSMLMGAMDEDGTQMTPRQLRDETMTLFLAGHETTALTLSWTWYLLSQNPAAEARLHEELRGVLGERAPGVADLERLPYLSAVISEVLRMYPPAYIMARTSIAPSSFGGYDFPVGSTMMVSQWVMHRDARYFDDPDSFRPERWLDGLADRLPAGAYFPFGDGPRRCIGQGFALLESALVIGALAQRFRFELVPGTVVTPEPLVTLRPKNGIRMTIHAR